MSAELLPLQLLYQGKIDRCHPQYPYPLEFDVRYTPNHWANEDSTLRFISNIILPHVKAFRAKNGTPDQGALVIFDISKVTQVMHSRRSWSKIISLV